MSKQVQRDIWDVIFNLDTSHFPLSRNYLEQPRGSANPINSQVSMKPKNEYLAFAKTLSPVDLYALDFELNLLFRKLADFILFADKSDVYEDSPVYRDVLFFVDKKIEELLYSGTGFSVNDLFVHAYTAVEGHIHYGANPLDNVDEYMRSMAELQFSIQYYIENSDWDWRTKAEAFLRTDYYQDFEYSRNDTLIYLSNKAISRERSEYYTELENQYCDFMEFDEQQEIHTKALKQSHLRWDEYKIRWDILGFSDENPFSKKSEMSNLRLMDFDSGFLDTLLYNSESQHLLSAENIRDFTKLINLFRTGLNNKIAKKKCANIYREVKEYLFNSKYTFGYNYTVSDKSYLLFLLYHFISGRLAEVARDGRFYATRDSLLVDPLKINSSKRNFSTVDYTKTKPPLSLLCFNMHAVWFSKPKNYLDYVDEASQRIISHQNKYGYWCDSTNNPESTTVLALDALNIRSEDLSFPLTKITLPKDERDVGQIYVEYDAESRILTVGNQQIQLTTSQWGLFEALAESRQQKLPLPITSEGKNAVDYLRKKLLNKKHLKNIIVYKRLGRKGIYHLAPNVSIKNRSFAWLIKPKEERSKR